MTLTEFLLARIAEDEAVAREAGAVQVPVSGNLLTGFTYRESVSWEIEVGHDSEFGDTGRVEIHPSRVLRDCEAKRQIVEVHRLTAPDWCENCEGINSKRGGCATLRLLAPPYADHPDCRPEWKP